MPKIIATELDWIKLGMQKFADGGAEALVIEQLAKQLGSSKTSFYWYFKNRVLYVERIVNFWHEQATTAIINHIQQHDALEPIQKVQRLLTVMFSSIEGKDFVYHFRKLGTTSLAYAELLQQIEKQRLDYMQELLITCGLLEEEARNTAELLYGYYLGWYERNKHLTLKPEEARLQIDLLMPFIEKKIVYDTEGAKRQMVIAAFIGSVLFIIGAIHIYWVLGGHRGVSIAVPTKNHTDQPLFTPGRIGTAAVAILFLAASALILMYADIVPVFGPAWLPSFAGWAIAIVFLVRATGEFRAVGFFKTIRNTAFARMDTYVYSPLCFVVSCLSFWLMITS